MKKNFKNINEELERIKTLMFETDNFIKNGTPLNEQTAPVGDTSKEKTDFKTARSSFKLAKISDLNTILRGGASKFDTYKVKGTGVMNLFDATGKMTPEGIELMKKSGLTLPAGQIIMRIGKVDDPNTDKVFFQVVPTKEISVVTKSGDIKNLDPTELENLPTVQDLKPTAAPAPVQKPSETTTFVEDKSLIGKKIEDLAKQFNLKITDITEKFKEAGYTASPFYKKNEDTKTVYGVDKDGNIKSIFKRLKGEKVEAVAESFNMDIIFTNPLLFESVISEQETTPDYYIKTDAAGKETKMNNKFTQVVDGTWKGGGSTTGGGGTRGGGESKPSTDPWANYPCITSNSAIKKIDDPKMGIFYQDAANNYYSNGRYYNFKTKKKGDYRCEENKIVAVSPASDTSFDAEKIAMELYTALWRNDFNEDEDAVYEIFKDKIKSDDQLQQVLNTYTKQKEEGKHPRSTYNGKTLQSSITNLFNSGEISRLNGYISNYSSFKF